jgi:phosphoribosyl 1,2-cyclic phosphodiesterase
VRYGGNTSCVEVRGEAGEVLVLDAGTGMRPLGLELQREQVRTIHVLLSHLHLDHLQGLGFFRPLFDPDNDVHIWGPPSPVQSLADRIAMYLSAPLFPVRLADIPAKVTFHDAPEEAVEIGGLAVRASLVTHQGPTVGWRIEEGGRSAVYLPDHEPGLGVDVALQPKDWLSGYDLANRADVLLHDAQYGDDEYPGHVGWGHSAVGHVVAFAQKTDVDHLVLFHHDPGHTDAEMDAQVDEARRLWGDSSHRVCSAWDGMVIDLEPAGVALQTVPPPT